MNVWKKLVFGAALALSLVSGAHAATGGIAWANPA